MHRLDRMLLAAFSRLIPRERWSAFSVTPQTLLRWHRDLVRRKWPYKLKRVGRPEGYVFSDPSRGHRFIFVDQAAEDIDPANTRHLG